MNGSAANHAHNIDQYSALLFIQNIDVNRSQERIFEDENVIQIVATCSVTPNRSTLQMKQANHALWA
jgi:hypothetical protein